jgi:hypothetical protein
MQLALPYWMESEERNSARWKLAGVVALTLGTTGVRCGHEPAMHILFATPLFISSLTFAIITAPSPLIDAARPTPLCSVLFNFLGRDFFNALSAKDQEKFSEMLIKWLAAICLGIPVYVMR